MGEVMGLGLNADWVILSACNTASSSGKGSEALSGLGQAFFYAGARSILATSWSVETTSATALTTGLFQIINENAKLSKAERLRQSKLRLIDDLGILSSNSGAIIAYYSHLLFWAPFIIVGDGRGDIINSSE